MELGYFLLYYRAKTCVFLWILEIQNPGHPKNINNKIYTEFKSNNLHLVSSSDIYMVMNFITWAELRLVDLIVKRIH